MNDEWRVFDVYPIGALLALAMVGTLCIGAGCAHRQPEPTYQEQLRARALRRSIEMAAWAELEMEEK